MSKLHSGGRQVFGAVAKADTDLPALIRRNLRAVGRTDDTEVTAFTDGCPGLRSILVDAEITTPPILDWFHIAMRMQHATQTASGLPADDPGRMQAKSVIVEEVERLRWRIWNGKAKNAGRSIDRVRKVMHVYREARGHNMRSAPSHRLWHTLLDVDGYLRGRACQESRVKGRLQSQEGNQAVRRRSSRYVLRLDAPALPNP